MASQSGVSPYTHYTSPPGPPSSPCTTIITMHTISTTSSSTSFPSLIPSGFQVYVLLDILPIPPSVVGILVKGFIDLYVLPGKGLSLSPPQDPKAILIGNRDVYMINPCSADISFVVELCETLCVKLKRWDVWSCSLASIPKSFRVWVNIR